MTIQYEFKTQPFYENQLKVFEETKDKKAWAFFIEMGLGKSWIAINTFGYLFETDQIDAVVITAKKGEYANWTRYEIPAHLPDRIKRETVLFSSLKASSVAFKNSMKSLCRTGRDRLPILVVNIESLAFGGSKVLEQFYKAHKRVMLVVDESTCVKHYDSKRSKETYLWAFRSAYKRIMTGTAVTQSPMDLWGQSMVLGKGLLGFTSYFAFRNNYCVIEIEYLGARTFQRVVGYRNLERLAETVKSFSHQLLKEQCLDLPPKIYTQRVVPLTPKQEQMYTQLKNEAILELEGTEIEVINVLSQITKLHQIVCGQLKIGDNEYASIENERISTLLDIVEDYEGKVIIWATYRQTLVDVARALRDKFGKGSVSEYHGSITGTERDDGVFRFKGWRPTLDANHQVIGKEICVQENQSRFMVANPQSGGFGNTWTEANLVIYYSNGYNLEHRLQSEDRNHRIGQTKPVTYIDLVTPDTVDERIMEVLRNKKNMSDLIMSRPVRSWF